MQTATTFEFNVLASLLPVKALTILPTDLFLKAINRTNFSDNEIGAIGEELIKRFPKQKQLEIKCKELFG